MLLVATLCASSYLTEINPFYYREKIPPRITEFSKPENSSKPLNCERDVKLGKKGQFKITMLASFAGSGNTWSRFLIENASGYYTGSVFNDKKLCK